MSNDAVIIEVPTEIINIEMPPEGRGGNSEWGQITGTLSNQTDLQNALDNKADIIITTATGNVASFTDGIFYPAQSLLVTVNPNQDLHGYDYPWTAGNGKNIGKLSDNNKCYETKVTYSYTETGVTAESTGTYGRIGFSFPATEGETYTVSCIASKSEGTEQYPRLVFGTKENAWGSSDAGFVHQTSITTTPTKYSKTITATSDGVIFFGLYISTSVYPRDVTVTEFQVEKGSTATPFAPYENICPISTRSSATVNHSEADTSNPDTVTINFGESIWGGSLNYLTGALAITDAEIASYAGETLPGTWISDRDAYAPGKTPTTGAQVVYKVANPTVIQLTGHDLTILSGTNNIWADCGPTSVTYRADTKLYIDSKITAALANI